MTRHRYPTLLAAALAVAFIGAAAAQPQSDDTSRLPTNKGTAQESQAQPAQEQTPKMQGQNSAMNGQNQSTQTKNGPSESDRMDKAQKEQTKNSGAMASGNEAKPESAMGHASARSGMQHQAMSSHMGTRHAGKSKRPSEEAAAPDEKAYRQALRDCAKQQDSSQRDSCLDSAIERFHRNA